MQLQVLLSSCTGCSHAARAQTKPVSTGDRSITHSYETHTIFDEIFYLTAVFVLRKYTTWRSSWLLLIAGFVTAFQIAPL